MCRSMTRERPFSRAIDLLRAADLRPTRQRLALARLLFEGGDRHVTAERLHEEASTADVKVSLATVYNTLHQFTAAGLLREIVVDGTRSYFDTNTCDHHHFFFEGSGRLADIPAEQVVVAAIPPPPSGTSISRVDVIVRVSNDNDQQNQGAGEQFRAIQKTA
jgi:Fur family transcriptional regulator, iron response regulator